jgi:hypothetical protein
MATRISLLRYLTAALVAGFALSLAPSAPAFADEDPGARTKRYRTVQPRVRTVVRTRTVVRPVVRTVVRTVERPVVQVRTVERVRTRTRVVCYDYTGRPFDCRTPAPVMPQPEPQQVVQVASQPVHYTCGGCAPAPQPVYTTCGNCAPAPAYYGTGCGGCAPTGAYYSGHGGYGVGYGGYGVQHGGYYRSAAPYRWAVRHARHVHRHAYPHRYAHR